MDFLPGPRRTLRHIAAIAFAVVLGACGGGQTSDFDPPQDTAEGIWIGSTSSGFAIALAILENGETWGVYSAGVSGPIAGAIRSDTVWSAGRLGGHGQEFNLATRSVSSFTYLGTFNPRDSIAVTTSSSVQLRGSFLDMYLEPALLSEVAGTYTGSAVTGRSPVQSTTFTVAPDGQVTVPPSQGCSARGSVVPRASRRNVFDVGIVFTGANCALGNGATARGVAFYDRDSRRMIVMGMNETKSDGFMATGLRQRQCSGALAC